jgi:hypothetical protein
MKLLFSLCARRLLTACLAAEERMEAARQQNVAQDGEKCQRNHGDAFDELRARQLYEHNCF